MVLKSAAPDLRHTWIDYKKWLSGLWQLYCVFIVFYITFSIYISGNTSLFANLAQIIEP